MPGTSHDRRGHTPFDYARREHYAEWMSFLQENKALIERRVALVSSMRLILMVQLRWRQAPKLEIMVA
jgi:hypothetical protein